MPAVLGWTSGSSGVRIGEMQILLPGGLSLLVTCSRIHSKFFTGRAQASLPTLSTQAGTSFLCSVASLPWSQHLATCPRVPGFLCMLPWKWVPGSPERHSPVTFTGTSEGPKMCTHTCTVTWCSGSSCPATPPTREGESHMTGT